MIHHISEFGIKGIQYVSIPFSARLFTYLGESSLQSRQVITMCTAPTSWAITIEARYPPTPRWNTARASTLEIAVAKVMTTPFAAKAFDSPIPLKSCMKT